MQYTQNKVYALRRLLLGNLYDKCKDGGATREEMQEQLTRIQTEGHCLQDCSVDDFANICEMKTRTIPACFSSTEEKQRSCMDEYREDEFKRRFQLYDESNAQAVQANWVQYTRSAKLMEDWPDSDEEDEEDTELTEQEECMFCHVEREDEQGNKEEIITLPCGHTVHPSCVLDAVKSTGKTTCPVCRQLIPSQYTGNIHSILEGKWRNFITTVNGVNTNEEPLTEESLPFISWLHFTATDEASKSTMATQEEKTLFQTFLASEQQQLQRQIAQLQAERLLRQRPPSRQQQEQLQRQRPPSRQQQERLQRLQEQEQRERQRQRDQREQEYIQYLRQRNHEQRQINREHEQRQRNQRQQQRQQQQYEQEQRLRQREQNREQRQRQRQQEEAARQQEQRQRQRQQAVLQRQREQEQERQQMLQQRQLQRDSERVQNSRQRQRPVST